MDIFVSSEPSCTSNAQTRCQGSTTIHSFRLVSSKKKIRELALMVVIISVRSVLALLLFVLFLDEGLDVHVLLQESRWNWKVGMLRHF